MDFSELLNDFIGEAREHVGILEAGLINIEAGKETAETINEIFRAVHTIKGSAGIFSLTNIVGLSHALEDLFGTMRETKSTCPAEMIDVMLRATDELKRMVNDLEASKSFDIEPLVEKIRLLNTKLVSAKNMQASEADEVDPMEAIWAELTASTADTQPSPDVRPVKEATYRPVEKAFSGEETVRVSVGLLDELLNVTGELVLFRNQLMRLTKEIGEEQNELKAVAQNIHYATASLQEKIIKTRMYPISTVFNKFPRIVRELSRQLNKDVELILLGSEVELDRSVIEGLTDPITHLVRNALDHGIERPDERIERNKPATGTIKLHAYNQNDRVIVEIVDDGGGIDYERVRQIICDRKILTEDKAELLSDRELAEHLFHPGFSTAKAITDISGRGVGMDVVKTNIEALGGEIEIYSSPGTGTTVKLELPLTLAIIPILIVGMKELVFAIPQLYVHECVLLQPHDHWPIHNSTDFFTLNLRGKLLPLVRLSDVMGVSQHSENYFELKNKSLRILILKSGSLVFGLEVENIHSQGDMLVKPVPPGLDGAGFYSGVTVLGDGQIAMVITPERIAQRMRIHSGVRTGEFESARQGIGDSGEGQHILLLRAFGEEVLGIELGMVRRVVRLTESQSKEAMVSEHIRIEGEQVRLIHMNKHLPLSSGERAAVNLFVVLPEGVDIPVAIVVREIVKTVQTVIQLEQSGNISPAVIGTTQIEENEVLLIDLYKVLELAVPEFIRPNEAVQADGGMIRVLLLEDNDFFAKLVIGFLSSAGYEVIRVENGRDGIDYLHENQVDIVVSDVEMPVMDGLEFVRKVRSDPRLRHLPVMALTSLSGETHKDRGLRAGFDMYENKTDKNQLLESIATLLSTTQARRHENGPSTRC